MAELVVGTNYAQASCALPASLTVQALIDETTTISSVKVVDANLNPVWDLRVDPDYPVNAAGGDVIVLVTFADGYTFDGSSFGWESVNSGAAAKATILFAATPTAVDCTVVLGPVEWNGDDAPDTTAISETEGVDTVAFVAADGDVVAYNKVVVTLLPGYSLDALASPDWVVAEDGSVVSEQPQTAGRGISPMSINDSSSGITAFIITPDSVDDLSESVSFVFTYRINGAPTLQEGDTIEFDVTNFDLLGTTFTGDQCIILEQRNSSGDIVGPPIGCVEIDSEGHGVLTLNEQVNGKSFAEGSFEFRRDTQWAANEQTDERVTIPFSVEQDGRDPLEDTLSIPPKPPTPETPVPTPESTTPGKSGRFANGDDGRTEPNGAIKWVLSAPRGPAAGAVLVDKFRVGGEGTDFGDWSFDCANYAPVQGGQSGVTMTTDCQVDAGVVTVTVTFGPYNGGNPPSVTLTANITDTDNKPLPEQGTLTFWNKVESQVWQVGDNPATDPDFGTGTAEAQITQHGIFGPEDSREPTKYASWTTGSPANQTGGLTSSNPSKFLWTVRAPAGPADGAVITDTAPLGWEFICSTFQWVDASWAGGNPESRVRDTCSTTSIMVTLGKYMEPQANQSPGFSIVAVQTAPQPEYLRDVLTFANTAQASILPYNSGENGVWTEAADSNEAKVVQTPVPEPGTNTAKDARFTRRDAGRYNKDQALEWTITLPNGKNGGVVVQETSEAGKWVFDCDTLTVTDGGSEYLAYTETVPCGPGGFTFSFAGYESNVRPVIKVKVDLLVEYSEENTFGNTAKITIKDYLEVTTWGDENTPGFKTADASRSIQQKMDSSGTGTVGEFKVSIGDYVWFDQNHNGIQDEPASYGIANVKVELFKKDGTPVGETTTDANGYYFFIDLDSDGEYYLIFTQPAGYKGCTLQNEGSDDAVDSDVVPATGRVDFKAPTMGANEPPRVGEGYGPYVKDMADDPTLDAGLYKLVSIGDYVWFDYDRNGVQGPTATEPGIDGVTVTITGPGGFTASTVTSGGGYYEFLDLLPNTPYELTFTKPTGYDGWTVQGPAKNPSESNPAAWVANDSDVNQTTGKVAFTTPIDGINGSGPGKTDNPNLDAGVIITKVSVGDYVWIDTNANGLQDAGEEPVAGVLVTLLNADGSPTGRTATTDSNGYYYFKDLQPKTGYQLQFSNTPAGYVWTTQNAGADNIDSDVDTNGWLAFTSPEFGQNKPWNTETPYVKDLADDPTLDAGLVKLVSVGDYVWYDVDRDGIQDAGEPAVAGVKVTLYRTDAPFTPIATDTTDGNGWYSFTDLRPNVNYFLVFEKPAEYTEWTLQDVGGNDAVDSDVNQFGVHYFLLYPDTSNNVGRPDGTPDDPTRDAGLIKKVSIGDYVWFDDSFNGLQEEAPSPGVSGATVELYAADGTTLLGSTTTDANGYYFFKDLQPNTVYQLKFTHNQDGYGWTKQDQGANDAFDSDVNQQGWVMAVHTPNQGQNRTTPGNADVPTYDAGIVKLVSIGDYVWFDYDRDGVQGTHEKEEAIANVKVTLKRVDGTEADRVTTTDVSGYYGFKDLYPGADYELIFEKPANYDDWTLQNAGSDDAKDSDVDPDGKIAFKAPVTPNNNLIGQNLADNPTLDAGLVIKKVSIGDYVWYDTNLDGIQDPGEPVAPGIKVTLFDEEGTELSSTTTDANGYYYFRDLEPLTTYSVVFEKPDNYAFTKQNIGDDAKDSDADKDGKVTFTTPEFGKNQPWPEMAYVKDLADDPTIDAGLVKLVSVGDYVWFDENRDGVQDPGELPVQDVKVTLYDKDGTKVGGTTTDANGFYSFNNLYPDEDYTLIFEKPDGYAGWTTPNVGDDTKDSDVDPAGRVDFRSPVTGENSLDTPDDPTLDAGLIRIVSIGDYVWFDADRDGIQDAGEVPVAGVKVTLFDKDGNKVGGTTTDGTGYYYFKDLEPSTDYYLIFEKPDGFAGWTVQGASSDTAVDSNVDPATGRVDFTLPEKGNNLTGPNMADDPTLDGGLIRLVSIGDYVWYDSNGNGKQDPGEKPAKDIKVTLYDKYGNKVGETTTDEDGYYYFKDLEPSTQYKLVFEKPAGYNWTTQGAGSNKEIDSDVNYLGEITFISPASGNNLVGPNMTDNPTLDAGLVVIPPTPEKPPVVEELPKTGSGADANSMVVLATLAGMVMAAGAVRYSVSKRS